MEEKRKKKLSKKELKRQQKYDNYERYCSADALAKFRETPYQLKAIRKYDQEGQS